VEVGVANAINDFIVGCKADGIWSAIKASCILMGARTLSGALTPLKGGAPTNVSNNFVSADYNRKTGLKGDGSVKRLTVSSLSGIGQDDNSLSIFVTEDGTQTFRWCTGFDANTNIALAGALNSMTFRSSTNATNNLFFGGPPNFFAVSRTSSASFDACLNSSITTISQASAASTFGNFAVFVQAATTTALFDGRIAFYHAGAGLNNVLLNSRVSALYTAIGAAIP